ncbi:hypothetical protein GCM10023146_33840 [Nocardioides caricicola]
MQITSVISRLTKAEPSDLVAERDELACTVMMQSPLLGEASPETFAFHADTRGRAPFTKW